MDSQQNLTRKTLFRITSKGVTGRPMIIAGKRKWEVFLKYYPPWDGRKPAKRLSGDKRSLSEVVDMVGDPTKLENLPKDVKELLKVVPFESFLQEA
jgi:hypothetical protein